MSSKETLIEEEILIGLYYGEDLTYKEIGDIFGVDAICIFKYIGKLEKYGYESLGDRRKVEIEPELLWGLYWGNGYTIKEIANIFNYYSGCLCKKFKKYNIPTRKNTDISLSKRLEKFELELLEQLYLGEELTKQEISTITRCSTKLINQLMEYYTIPERDVSDETRKRISESRKGAIVPQEVKNKISESYKNHKLNCSCIACKSSRGEYIHSLDCKCASCRNRRGELWGEDTPNWKGGINLINRGERHHLEPFIKLWRIGVYKRDYYTCQMCGKHGGKLHAHHIKSWKDFPELRFDLDNGITLCAECHRKTFKRKIDLMV